MRACTARLWVTGATAFGLAGHAAAAFVDTFEDLAPGTGLGTTPVRTLGPIDVTLDPGFATTLNAASYSQNGPGDVIAFSSGAGGVANAPDDPALVSGDVFLTTSTAAQAQGFPGLELFFSAPIQELAFTTINLAERNRTVTLRAFDASGGVVDELTVEGNAAGTPPAPSEVGRVVRWEVGAGSASIVRAELVSSNFDGWGLDDLAIVVPGAPGLAMAAPALVVAASRRRPRRVG